MTGPERTLYTFVKINPAVPRCRNTHTLVPMFVMRGPGGEVIEDPVPVASIPQEFFWRNSDGYGFDVRNLSVLLRVNFRNINPHMLESAMPRRCIWCNQYDLTSLLTHPALAEGVKANVTTRVLLLNQLSDNSKRLLASAAFELYSASFQGFYDWVADQQQFDNLMQALGMTATQIGIMRQVEELQDRRRVTTLRALQTHLSTQAAEHFCEPSGVPRDSDLYKILEFYKANVASNLIEYLTELSAQRRNICKRLEDKLQVYRIGRMVKLMERYAKAFRRFREHARTQAMACHLDNRVEVLLFHIVYTLVPPTMTGPTMHPRRVFHTRARTNALVPPVFSPTVTWVSGRGRTARSSPPPPPPPFGNTLHMRVYYLPITGDFMVRINEMELVAEMPTDVLRLADETIPALLSGPALYQVTQASVAGDLIRHPRPGSAKQRRRWQRTHRSDNQFLRSQAESWLLQRREAGYTSWIDKLITQESEAVLWKPDADARVQAVLYHVRRRHFKDIVYISIATTLAKSAPDIFEFELLNRIELRGGYDDFEGTLLDKLRAAMSGRTCIQDVAGELCELLSVPYPPEHHDTFAAFQCDHTGIVEPIVRRNPVRLVPITHMRLYQDVPNISLEYRQELANVTHGSSVVMDFSTTSDSFGSDSEDDDMLIFSNESSSIMTSLLTQDAQTNLDLQDAETRLRDLTLGE